MRFYDDLQPILFKDGLQVVPPENIYNNDSGIQSWLRQHPSQVVIEFRIAELFNAAYGRGATVQNGTTGFRKARIYPFNKDFFIDEDFLCSQMQCC